MPLKLEQDFSHLQDVLGSVPQVKRYIVLCLCFSFADSTSSTSIESHLRDALARLAAAFPWLAGQVIYEGRDDSQGRSGVPKVVPLAPTIELITNDLRHNASFPSLRQMQDAKYPFSMLDPAVLAPPLAASWSRDGFDKIAPVLMLQANLVQGGLILTVSGNHTQMDMTGMGLIISLFSKACRNEAFTEEEVRQGNQARGNAVPLLDHNYQPGPELDDVILPQSNGMDFDPLACKPRWAYFYFTPENLARLKSEASKQTIVPFISTDDAVVALCWQRLAATRVHHLGDDASTTFCRPVSMRKWLGLQGYIGHMVDCVSETQRSVHRQSLGDIAAHLRLRLSSQHDDEIRFHVRAYATLLHRLADKSTVTNGARLDPRRDLVVSSYANIKCCDLAFGEVLGRPDAARRPRMDPWPSLFYLMPKARDGSIAVAFCLGEEEMESIKTDEGLSEYAEYIG